MDDRHQIIEQLNRFAAGLDGKDWELLRGILAEDAYAYSQKGRDAIIGTVRGHIGGCGATQHLLGNHRIEVDGDGARSLTYARVYHEGAGDHVGSFFECLGEYEDHWTRTGDGWRLSYRKFDMRIRMGDFAVLQPG
ncbi:nuclear transport factor 2 family protein [Actinocorallia aurantiaca]|jgi:hypothetical protein|uniref:SnoaL-like domain-containing protein n=1 Tax=Actinocorallia aurantiaca TaxID=46204 RepID=A0ABP6GJI6_9ACTN